MGFDASFYEIRDEVRNWGRWGDDDRLGTLNLITDDVVARAAGLVRTGRRISLALPLSHAGPQLGQIPGRVNPLHTMISIDHADLGGGPDSPHFSDDVITMACQAGTHWDGLSHVSYDGTLYNGVPTSTITARSGSEVLGIENVRHLTGRGVLLDVARATGVERLEGGQEVTGEMLDAAAEWAGVAVEPGDIVLIRTGWITVFLAEGPRPYVLGPDGMGSSPGPGMASARWFRRHDVAAVADDTYIFEVFPGPSWDNALALHCLDVVDIGLTQGQNWHLEELAEACVELGRHEFLLQANPEPIVGGCGAPVNPVAVL